MSKFNLTSGFSVVPEGKHIFKITGVNYDENFGVMEINMTIANGIRHRERFTLLDSDNQPREKAMNAFSYFAKTALNNFGLEEIDHTDLIGHYILGQIVHTVLPNRNKPGQTVTFANMGDKAPGDGFDHEPVPSVAKMINAGAAPAPAPAKAAYGVAAANVDLDALLG